MGDSELRSGLERLVSRVGATLRECGDAYPYSADPATGRWFTTADGNWCGGHWVSMLWMSYELTGEPRFQTAAVARTAPLRDKLAKDDMFRSFAFYYAGAEAYRIAGLDWQRELALKGAGAVAGMYESSMRQIPIGDEVDVLTAGKPLRGRAVSAVDNIYACLILPWWAWRETGESRYRDVAIAHADRTIDLFIRPDSSTIEFIEFDRASGEPRRHFTRLGCADDSCWSRGQAWCIAGLALAYENTGDLRYLEMASRTTGYFIEGSPPDHVPYYDFTDPDIPRSRHLGSRHRERGPGALVQPARSGPRGPCPRRSGLPHRRLAGERLPHASRWARPSTSRDAASRLLQPAQAGGQRPRVDLGGLLPDGKPDDA